MKPAAFEYHAPDSLEQALQIMRLNAGEGKILAGGQSLVPAMNFRVAQPSVLIDLNRVSELSFIREEGETIRIGAMARERHLEFDSSIAKRIPLLTEATPFIAHPQIRNRGTIGGSIVNADPAAELPVLMLALNARLKARNASNERWIDAPDFSLACSAPRSGLMKFWLRSNCHLCQRTQAGRSWKLRRAQATMH